MNYILKKIDGALALKPDQRSKTSAANGKRGGRPKELTKWDGGIKGETWTMIPSAQGIEFKSDKKNRRIRINKGSIRLIIKES